MPSSSRLTELCRYHYDPLDRQAGCTLTRLQPATLQRFYCKSRLATEIQGAVGTHLFQHDDQLLAQHRHQNDKVDTTLLATDQQRSVLSALDTTRPHPLAYSPYGHRPAENGLLSLLGFNGERPDPVTGHYHLGNGYRQFNPVLMRFNSPDSWSPFGEGGLNAYVYCGGDPKNRTDPTGHFWGLGTWLRSIGLMKQRPVLENILKGAELKYKGKTLEMELPINQLSGSNKVRPINLNKISAPKIDALTKKITDKTETILNSNHTKLGQIQNPHPEFLKFIHESSSKILTFDTSIGSNPKDHAVKNLAAALISHREAQYTEHLTNQALNPLSTSQSHLATALRTTT